MTQDSVSEELVEIAGEAYLKETGGGCYSFDKSIRAALAHTQPQHRG